MRATLHNGRYATVNGQRVPFSPKHPDRNFDVTKSDHIDPTKPCAIKFIENDIHGTYDTFEEQEQAFYVDRFSEHIANQNARMIELRNKKKCKTIEDYRKSTRTCPEETIMQVGKWNNRTKQADSVPSEELKEMFYEFEEWHYKKYPQAVILNAAIHSDEPKAAPHVHMRKVWISKDENGAYCVNQTKALQDMGVKAPDPTKPVSRNNNPKITYTSDCREKWEEIIKARDYELEERLEKSKTGLSHTQYIENQISEAIDEKQADLDEREAKIDEKASKVRKNVSELNERIRTYNKKSKALHERTEALHEQEKQVQQKALENEQFLQQLQRMASQINKQIKIKNQIASLEDISMQSDGYDKDIAE